MNPAKEQTERDAEDFTSWEILNDGSSGRMEDDICSIIEVVKVITTIKAPVTKHVIQRQLLQTHTSHLHTEQH